MRAVGNWLMAVSAFVFDRRSGLAIDVATGQPLVTPLVDQRSGLVVQPTTGQLIDPRTGAIVDPRAVTTPGS